MLSKTKSVQGICDKFTSELEAVQAEQEKQEAKLKKEIEKANEKLTKAQQESKAAANAISRIRKLFATEEEEGSDYV